MRFGLFRTGSLVCNKRKGVAMNGLANWGIIALICGLIGLPIAGIIEDRKGVPSIGAIIAGMGIVFLILVAIRFLMLQMNII